MSLQSNGSSWTVSVRLPDRIVRIGIGSKKKLSRAEAGVIADSVESQVMGQLDERRNPGFCTAVGLWVRSELVAPSTIKNHRQVMDTLANSIGEIKLSTVTPLHLVRWISEADVSIATKRKYARVAKAFFGWASRTYSMQINPAAHLKSAHPRVAAEEKFTPTTDQMQLLINWSGGAGVLFAIAALSGMRRGEVLRLKPHDIEFGCNKITVRTERCVEGTKQRYRTVRLDPQLHEILWTKLWWNLLPCSASNANKMLKRAAEDLGVPFTFNSLRRWRAMSWRGVYPDHVVNKWLGHTEAVARSTYLSVEDKYYDK